MGRTAVSPTQARSVFYFIYFFALELRSVIYLVVVFYLR